MSATTDEARDPYQKLSSEKQDNAAMKYGLTNEEVQVLEECKMESFWYRCVPFSFLAVGTNHILAKRGILTPHPKFGLLSKNLIACLFAYVMGKISYQSKCREKILRLENSPLADGMRRGLKFTEVLRETQDALNNQAPTELPDSKGVGEVKLADDYGNSMDIDMDKNVQLKGLEDANRSLDISTDVGSRLPISQPDVNSKDFTTHDDLRRMNRESHERRMSALNTPPPPPPQRSDQHQPLQPVETPAYQTKQPGSGVRRNKYGDIIEE